LRHAAWSHTGQVQHRAGALPDRSAGRVELKWDEAVDLAELEHTIQAISPAP